MTNDDFNKLMSVVPATVYSTRRNTPGICPHTPCLVTWRARSLSRIIREFIRGTLVLTVPLDPHQGNAVNLLIL